MSGALFCVVASAAQKVDFNRDIQPILSDNCFFCHGPDANKRKGKLRLDIREEAIQKKAFVPGKPDESELVSRIFTKNADDLMPPEDSHKKLTDEQKNLLKRWINDGAEYQSHWAYTLPVKPTAGMNGIDALVEKRLGELELKPSPEADRRTLARRLHFDLVGLPPKPEEVEAFERNNSRDAYQKLVERLLASPHYGERMAIGWLDVARFADTIGYHSDNPRNIWPYRDYVIKSFNENKPFDQFTREQLAGDLLPNSTQEQKVASAFNRLLLSTEEGGAQPKDYEARMLTDRVRAVGSVWLGQTIGCAQCHDHKFDPITQRDFYSMGAFFADIKEPIIGRREDGMLVPDGKQAAELARRHAEIERLQKDFDAPHPELADAFAQWEQAQLDALLGDSGWISLKPVKSESSGGAKLDVQTDNSILASGKKADKDTYALTFENVLASVAGFRIEALPNSALPSNGPGRADNGNFVLTEVIASIQRSGGSSEPLKFTRARASFEQTTIAENNPYKAWKAAAVIDGDGKGESFGWAVLPEVGKPHQLHLELERSTSLRSGDKLKIELRQNHGNGNHTVGHFRIAAAPDELTVRGRFVVPPSPEIAAILKVRRDQRGKAQADKLFALFKSGAPELANLRTNLAAARKARNDFEATVPRCIVSVSAEQPRTVRILPRGNWLIETGEITPPALPGYLSPQSSGTNQLTRLDLANWLVSRENPLTARVVMNRLWKQFFGVGLSKVLDDLGAQGEIPPNQPLLDWLASEFINSGWDTKHIVRLIMNSRAYKQVSTAPKNQLASDPHNREIARQSRWRLDAELVRDNALTIAGLLVPKIGGPSVKPFQPAGYWENLNFPTREWESSAGEDQYRRGLYTWWQRSYPHPGMVAFDAPSREECAAERNRSNIPQQALVLLNDPTYVEASRVFAARIIKEGGRDAASRLNWAWRQALARAPKPDEIETMSALLNKHLNEYRGNSDAASSLIKIGPSPVPGDVDVPELAAWTSVARVILNLHETITRS